jgi:hypothetical protein
VREKERKREGLFFMRSFLSVLPLSCPLSVVPGQAYFPSKWREPVPLAVKNQMRSKINSTVYVQSNCWTESGREVFVEELMKYLQVDSYGQCLHNRDLEDGMRGCCASGRVW